MTHFIKIYYINIALSKFRLTIFLFLVGITSSVSLQASDFAPPCDTIILVSSKIIVANINIQTNSAVTFTPCNESIEQTLLWNEIKDIKRWINPEIDKRKTARKNAAKEKILREKILREKVATIKEKPITKEDIKRAQLKKEARAAYEASLPTQQDILEKINWRIGFSVGDIAFTHLSRIDALFARQGFSTNNNGWFSFYNRIPRNRPFMTLSIDRKIKSNLFVGIKSTLSFQTIYAFKKSDYTVPSPSHLIRASLDYLSIDPKIEWISKQDPVSFYIGSSFMFITDNRFDTTKLNKGLLIGVSYYAFFNNKKHPMYFRPYIEFNAQENYWFQGETQKKLSGTNEIIANTFDGISLPFSHIKIGFELGFTFKKFKK